MLNGELNEPRLDDGADLVWPGKPHCGVDWSKPPLGRAPDGSSEAAAEPHESTGEVAAPLADAGADLDRVLGLDAFDSRRPHAGPSGSASARGSPDATSAGTPHAILVVSPCNVATAGGLTGSRTVHVDGAAEIELDGLGATFTGKALTAGGPQPGTYICSLTGFGALQETGGARAWADSGATLTGAGDATPCRLLLRPQPGPDLDGGGVGVGVSEGVDMRRVCCAVGSG